MVQSQSPTDSSAGHLFLVQTPFGVSDLVGSTLKKGKTRLLTDSLTFPVYIAALSALLLIVHIVASRRAVRHLWRRLFDPDAAPMDESTGSSTQPPREATVAAEIRERIKKHGGTVIFGFKLMRLLGCVVFLILCVVSAVLDEETRLGLGSLGKKHKKKRRREDPALSQKEWQDLLICMTSLYMVLLSLVTVGNKRRWSKTAARHLNVLLLAFLGVYAYRDVFPLATFNRSPLDSAAGWLLWAKICVLFLLAIVIPLTMPHQYVPFDPKEPMASPNAEQTASILSLITFSFLDSVVFLANRVPHLSSDLLPPLADSDYAQNLRARGFPHLDAFKKPQKSHLFFGLMRVFRKEYVTLSILLVIQVLGGFASPLGIRNLLWYIEKGGENATIKPWFWILWLFLGPTICSIANQWYNFVATCATVQVESMLTQLVFEHSLRIRMKAETQESSVVPNTTLTPEAAPLGGSTSTGVSVPEDARTSEILKDSSTQPEASPGEHRSETKSTKSESSKTLDNASPATKPPTSSATNLVGKINNLVTTDLGNITDARSSFLFLLIFIPLQISLCIVFLYNILGWSSLVGLAIMILLLPLPAYITKLIQDVQVKCLKKTDARVQTVSETMNVLRMIKMFGWEKKMNERIAQKREEELHYVWKRQVVVMHRELSASIVFSSMTVFDMLRDQIHIMFYIANTAIAGKVSIDRFDDFLRNTELLDNFTTKSDGESIPTQVETSEKVGIREASFTWSNDNDGSLTPSKRKFVLKIEHELVFAPNKINLIVGPTASGKTSILMALLGEMHYIPMSPDSWCNLPRSEGVAYAAQESWVQNETIRENILFGSPYDEERYNKVLHQCALTRDLSLFEAGDQTEVGEKGLTLSGGQKARITLARAVYSSAKILLLDDVLAALDVHTAKWVVEKCLAGDLVEGRTVLLVTHNVALARPAAGFIVSMGSDGRILSQGPISEVIKLDQDLANTLKADEDLTKVEEKPDDGNDLIKPSSGGKLIVAEEIDEGHVGWSSIKMYLSALGGKHPVLFFSTFVAGQGFYHSALAFQTWFLGFWASQYTDRPASDVSISYYLSIYGLVLLWAIVVFIVAYTIYTLGSIRASRMLHQKLMRAILGTTLRCITMLYSGKLFSDEMPVYDIRAIDGPVSSSLFLLSDMTLIMLTRFGAVVVLTPVFFLPGLLVALVGGICGQIYMKAQLPVKREMSNAKAPVLGHAAIAGLTSLRAYGAQEAFTKESMRRINLYTRAARTVYILNRWVCIRIDTMGALFSSGLAVYLVYFQSQGAANTGFSLNMAVGFSGVILWWVRVLNEFEVQGNSLERVDRYIKIEQEPKPTTDGIPPAYWPSSGSLKVERLSASYSADGPKVLHDISFDVKAGERIGILGRTGSGKSSLTLALLRCIYTEGQVFYDGRDTSTINLEALRSNITIIPQIPELLSGSLRQNLDPFDENDDATLNNALRSAGLFSLQRGDDESRLTLDSQISSGGSNLSVGQRQILALARAILRGSKLLILDEATSAIDHETDTVIQNSLRHELGTDVTVLTIAHRLQTIMDVDKILVLDAGRMIEFDRPSELLKNPKGMFRELVEESGDRERLLGMVKDDLP
ncbi:hypothetical protein H1R20_g10047, partial [Candolleomyces eurysporus]